MSRARPQNAVGYVHAYEHVYVHVVMPQSNILFFGKLYDIFYVNVNVPEQRPSVSGVKRGPRIA